MKLLQLDKGGIRVAAYLTELPSQDVLREKLHEAIRSVQTRIEQKELKE